MHKPTQQLRKAGAEGELRLVNDFQLLFDLYESSDSNNVKKLAELREKKQPSTEQKDFASNESKKKRSLD